MLQLYLDVDYVLCLHDRNDCQNEHRLSENNGIGHSYLGVDYVLFLRTIVTIV